MLRSPVGSGDEASGSREFPTLLTLATRALAENHESCAHFTCLPNCVAEQILESIRARGQLSLRTLLKFSSVSLDHLDVAFCGVTDEWMALIGSMPLKTLNLSNNAAVSDEGISILVGLSKPQNRRTSSRPPSSGAGGAASTEKKKRRAGGRRSGTSTPTRVGPSKSFNKSLSDDRLGQPDCDPSASAGSILQKSQSESLLSEDWAGCSASVSPSPSWNDSPRGSWGTPLKSAWPRGGEVYVLGEALLSVIELVLTGTSISNAGMALLLHLPLLRSLELCGTDRVGNSGVQSLADCLTLEELRLHALPKLSTGVQWLVRLRRLAVLELQGCCKLSDPCVEPLLDGDLPMLRRLDLSSCPKLSPALLGPLARTKTLRELDLTGSGVRDDGGGLGGKVVAELGRLATLPLTSLMLSDCHFPPDMLLPLAASLEHLRLSRCCFCTCDRCTLRHAYGGECHLPRVAHVLASMSALRVLHLVKCRLSPGSLPQALVANLTTLNVTDSQVPDLTVDTLLGWGRQLESLSASGWVGGEADDHDEGEQSYGAAREGAGGKPPGVDLSHSGDGTSHGRVGQHLQELELGRVGGSMAVLHHAGLLLRLRWLDLRAAAVSNKDMPPLASLTSLQGIDLSFCRRISSKALIHLPPSLTTLYAKGLVLGTGPDQGQPHGDTSDEEVWRSEDGVFEMTDDEEENEDDGKTEMEGGRGAEDLCGLRQLTRLEELDLSGTEVTVAALAVESGMLPPSLRKLHLNSCLGLALGLPEVLPPTLTHLQINGCSGLSDGAVEGVARKCGQLRELGVVGVQLGDAAAAAIASLRKLQVLGVRADGKSMLTDHGRTMLYSMPSTVVIVGGRSGWCRE